MSTLTIPSVNLPIGSRSFGSATVATAESMISMTIDRTLTNGLNALPATTTIKIQFQMSFDGGATWNDLALASFVGGIYSNPLQGQRNTDIFMCSIWNPGTPGRSARATVTVAGNTVRVAGTLTVT